MDLTTRSHSQGQFQFTFDNSQTFLCKSFDGGLAKGNPIEEPIGAELHVVKHLSTFEIEPMNIEVGMHDALPLMTWIKDSWNKRYSRKSGSVSLADFDMKGVHDYAFTDALITETAFPSLDAAGKEAAMLKVKIQPERAELKPSQPNFKVVAQANNFVRNKLWLVSHFALDLGKTLDTSRVAKIDGFAVKQGVKAYNTGRERFAFWEPTKLTFPDISVTMSMAYAGSMIDWYERTCFKGNTDPDLQVDGAIHYLAPDKKTVLFDINLFKVGMKAMTIEKSERGDNPRRVKFDLYVSWMDLTFH